MSRIELVNTPFIEHHLSYLRDINTNPQQFRNHADQIFQQLGSELYNYFPQIIRRINTPLTEMDAKFIETQDTLLIAILRSGYPMCHGIQKSFENTPIALIDIKRDETTAKPKLNYDGLPQSLENYRHVIIPDPMLATGGSACMTLEAVKQRGAKEITYISLISAQEGIDKIHHNFPDVNILVCATDPKLNERSYIVPGLGDFGDRYYGDQGPKILDEINSRILNYQPNGRFTIEEAA